jgi:hypothetical protein
MARVREERGHGVTDHEQDVRPYIDQIWPPSAFPKPKGWDEMACGINSNGAQPVYGPYPRAPRLELGDQSGEFFETRHRTYIADVMPFRVSTIYVRRRFKLIEPTPGTLSWEEIP